VPAEPRLACYGGLPKESKPVSGAFALSTGFLGTSPVLCTHIQLDTFGVRIPWRLEVWLHPGGMSAISAGSRRPPQAGDEDPGKQVHREDAPRRGASSARTGHSVPVKLIDAGCDPSRGRPAFLSPGGVVTRRGGFLNPRLIAAKPPACGMPGGLRQSCSTVPGRIYV